MYFVIFYFHIIRFTNFEDKQWFEEALVNVIKSSLGEEFQDACPEEPYFVDFFREAPEPTGEEDDDASLDSPKIYELVCILLIKNKNNISNHLMN